MNQESLAHYRILGKLGAGGMGVVYRAEDTKLKREVAIKVLPEAFAQDSERMKRLEREAQVLASLNHPNVAAIHSMEEHERTRFLVMELVPGDTLAKRLERGPIPFDEALPIFLQIGDALEAAHAKGILHRDLKPGNVQLDDEGRVKVLDFGLAKSLDGPAEPSEPAESPTRTRGTELGAILGTASYMSPEQARGKTLDRRSDVWSFGCVVYETLTGRKAFDGEDVTEVLAAIMKSDPDWSALPPDVPAHVRKLLRRCLSKDREKRLRDIGDALLELRDPPALEPALSTLRPSRSRAIWIFLGGLVLGGVAVYWATRPEGDPASKLTTRLSLTVPTGTRNPGLPFNISPDGRNVAYAGFNNSGSTVIYLRALDSTDVRAVAETRGMWGPPFFSPDGRWLAFFDENGLARVPIEGGTPQKIVANTRESLGAHWGLDGFIYYPKTYLSGIHRVRPDGGVPESVTELAEGDLGHWWPYLLPSGQALLYTVYAGGSLDDWEIRIHDLHTRKSAALIRGGYNARYAASGHILYGRSGALMAVPFDPTNLEIAGAPSPVVANVATQSVNAGMKLAVSNDGTLLFVEENRQDQLVWAGADGAERPAATERGVLEYPRISPDGSRVAVVVGGGVSRNVRLVDLARGAVTRLTYGHNDTYPAWSPDGAWVYFSSAPNGPLEIYRVPSDGGGEPQLVLGGTVDKSVSSLSSDGRWLAFEEDKPSDQPGQFDLSLLSLESGESRPFASSPFLETSPAFSPDGEWVAYDSNESGRFEVYLRRSDGKGAKIQVSTEGGESPVWSRAKHEIYFWSQNRVVRVTVPEDPSTGLGRPVVLFRGDAYRGPSGVASFDVGPSGEFLMVRTQSSSQSTEIRIVLNWFEELRRLSPTGRASR